MKLLLLNVVLCLSLNLFAQVPLKYTTIGSPSTAEYASGIVADDLGNNYTFGYGSGSNNSIGLIVKQNSNNQTIWHKGLTFPGGANAGINVTFMDRVADTLFGCGLINHNQILSGFYFKMSAQTGDLYWSHYDLFNSGTILTMCYYNGKFLLTGNIRPVNSPQSAGIVRAVSSQTGLEIWSTGRTLVNLPSVGTINSTVFNSATKMIGGKMFIAGLLAEATPTGGITQREFLLGINENGNYFFSKRIALPTAVEIPYTVTVEYDMNGDIILSSRRPVNSELVILKFSNLGDLLFAKRYNIPDLTFNPGTLMNETSGSYVFAGANFIEGFNAIKINKQGVFEKCIFVKKPNIFYTNASVQTIGNSDFRNNKHYFAVTEVNLAAADSDINKIILNENLTQVDDCSEITERPVNVSNLNVEMADLVTQIIGPGYSFTPGMIIQDETVYTPCTNMSLELEESAVCEHTVTANISGFHGPNFYWSTGAPTSSNSTSVGNSNMIIVRVIDARCCELIDTIVPQMIVTNMNFSLPADTTLCQGNSFTINPQISNSNGSLSYNWNNGNTTPTLQINAPGIYWLDATDSCGTVRDSIVINYIGLPQISGLQNLEVCENNFPVQLNPQVVNANFVIWENNSTVLQRAIVSAGIYTLSAFNSCGQSDSTVEVISISLPEISLQSSIDTCLQAGQNVILVPVYENVTSFLWSTGQTTTTINVSANGTYTVYGSNVCGIDSASVVFTLVGLPEINGLENLSVCENLFPFQLNPQLIDADSFFWEDNSTVLQRSVSGAGVFTLSAVNICGQTDSTIEITSLNLPEISLVNSIDTCVNQGQSVNLVPNHEYVIDFLWSNGLATENISVSTSGTYTVYGSNSCGTDSASVLVTINYFPVINLPTSIDTCFEIGEGFLFTAQGSEGNYQWSSGSQTATELITQEGQYFCTVTNNCGTATDSMIVTRLPDLDLYLPEDSILLCQKQISIDYLKIESYSNYEVLLPWSKQPAGEILTESGLYYVRAFNKCAELFDSVYIDLKEDQLLFMPNSFTPNADGMNDRLEISGLNVSIKSLRIFNRWGEEIYTLNEPEFQSQPWITWDGTYKGLPCQDGIYQVSIVYQNCFGMPKEFNGHVNLLR